MNKLLEQSIAGTESLTSDDLQAQLDVFDKEYAALCALQNRQEKAAKATELTEAIGELVEVSDNADEETRAKLTRLSNAVSQTFDGITEDDFVMETEEPGNEGIGKNILKGITFFGLMVAAMIAGALASTLLAAAATGAAIGVVAGVIMKKIDDHSTAYGDPKEDKITFKKLPAIGVEGRLDSGGYYGFMKIHEIMAGYEDSIDAFTNLVIARFKDDGKGYDKAVAKLAKTLGLSGPKTDGQYGKGLTYFISDTLPGDKFIVLKYAEGKAPSIGMVSDSKKYDYPDEIDALDIKEIRDLVGFTSDLGKLIETKLKETKRLAEKLQKDVASEVEKMYKDADEAEQKKAVKAIDSFSKQATMGLKVYADVAKYGKGLASVYMAMADKSIDNLEIKEK